MEDLSILQWVAIALIFTFTGFVRTAIGFGGAALGLPLLLLVKPDPVFFLPIISVHLLLFSGLTLYNRLNNVDWQALGKGLVVMIIPKMIGILGLLSLPPTIMTLIVFSITLFYGVMYLAGKNFHSSSPWVDGGLLTLGGYVSGSSLVGAPLIAAVYSRHVEKHRLRDTLFILWIILVTIKLSAFYITDVPLQLNYTLMLIPVVAVGHFIGLKVHQALIGGDEITFRRWVGGLLVIVTVTGLWKMLTA